MNSKELERLIELKVSECLNKILITDYIAKVMKESLQEVLTEQVSNIIKEEVSKIPRQQNNNYVSQNQPSNGNDLLRDLVKSGAAASRVVLSSNKPNQQKRLEEVKTSKPLGGLDVFSDISSDELSQMGE